MRSRAWIYRYNRAILAVPFLLLATWYVVSSGQIKRLHAVQTASRLDVNEPPAVSCMPCKCPAVQTASRSDVKESPAMQTASGSDVKESTAVETASGSDVKESTAVETASGSDVKESPAVQNASGNDVEDLFYFVPKGLTKCDSLFMTTKGQAFKYPDFYHSMKEEFLSHLRMLANMKMPVAEGHTGNYPEQFRAYYALANSSHTQTICETGFNAGHSTFQWLTGSTTAKVYSFDLGNHKYARHMASYLQSKFPRRLRMIWGDSTKSIPDFIETNPDVKCDLIIVDGGHSYRIAYADLSNFRKLAKPGHSVVIIDDISKSKGAEVNRAWDQFSKDWHIKDRFRCHFRTGKGFAVAQMP